MRFRKIFIPIKAFVALLGVAALIIGVLLTTPIGPHIAIALLKQQLPGKLQLANIDGSFLRGATFEQIHYQDPELEFSAAKVTAHINLQDLTKHRTLTLDSFTAKDLKLWHQELAYLGNKKSDYVHLETITGNASICAKALNFDITNAKGSFNQQNLDLKLHYVEAKKRHKIELLANIGTNKLEITTLENIEAKLILPNLAELGNKIKGAVHSDIAFDFKNLSWQTKLNAKDLSHYLFSSKEFDLKSNGTLKHDSTLFIKATAKDITIQEQKLEKLQLKLDGTCNEHHFKLTTKAYQNKLKLLGTATLKPSRNWLWHAKIATIENTLHDELWRLPQPADLSINNEKITLNNFTLHNNTNGKLAANFTLKHNKMQGNISAENAPITSWSRLLYPNLEIQGTPDLELNFNIAENNVDIKTQVTLNKATILWHQPGSSAITLPLTNAKIDAKLKNAVLKLAVDASSVKNKLSGNLLLENVKPKALPDTQKIQGNLSLKGQDMGLIMQLVPDVTRLKGEQDITFNVAGTIARPNIKAQGSIKKITATFPHYGIKIKPLDLEFFTENDGTIKLQGNGKMRRGPGSFMLKGFIKPNLPGIPNNISLIGENMEVINTQAYKIITSPNIDMQFKSKNKLFISGKLLVEGGQINLIKQEKSITISNDVIFTDSKVLEKKSHLEIIPDLFIKIDELKLINSEFNVNVFGKMQLSELQNQLVADGRITLKDGVYSIPGRTLYIHKGRLLYPKGTPLHNPNLDISLNLAPVSTIKRKDKKSVTDERSGLYVQGSLNDPQISDVGLFSGGSPLGQVVSASTSGVVDKVQDKFGLSEFGLSQKEDSRYLGEDVEQDADITNQQLVIGKKLKDKVQVQYLRSLAGNQNAVRLQYNLNDNWAASVESGNEGSGMDLNFSKESE